MGERRSEGLQHRWVAVGLVLTAGTAFPLQIVALKLLELGHWIPYVAAVLGALAGGYATARISPLRRLLEPVTGAAAFFGFAMAVMIFGQGDIEAIDFDPVRMIAGWAAILAGSSAGAWLGLRAAPVASRQRTTVVFALLTHAGAMAVGVFAALIVSFPPPVSLVFVALLLGLLLGGFVAQLLSPVRRAGSIALAGAAVVMLLILPSLGEHQASAASLGLAIVFFILPIACGLGSLGARIGWRVAERRRAIAAKPPTAAVVDET